MRAVAAFLGAQPALLYGYYLWGGVKEILAATLVATGFGLATAALPVRGLRSALPTVIVAVALADSLSLSGIVWLVPALAAVAVGAWRGSSPPFRRRVGVGAVIVAFGAAPALAMASFVSPFRTAFTGGDRAREPDQARQSASACGGAGPPGTSGSTPCCRRSRAA